MKRALSSAGAGAGYTPHGQTEAAHLRGLLLGGTSTS